ncbi:ankyrin repeat-containing domain protein [Phaeosphaeria sp. MPI-PUGE-AT-0046c]|nr:ankyrin repeat-containing domain protein [Phaeosphaeria sp. MPI-PUGE-AT-0046c]
MGQLTGLRMQLRAIHLCLHSINDSPDNVAVRECLEDVDKLFKRAQAVISDIDAFLLEAVPEPEGRGKKPSRPTESPKPSKRVWMRRKSTFSRLTLQVTSIVTALIATLQVLQSHQSSAFPQAQSTIVLQSISMVQEPQQTSVHQGIGAPLEHQMERTVRQLENDTTHNMTAAGARPDGTGHLSRQSSVDSFHSFASEHRSLPSQFVSICGTLAAEPCKQYCRCQCHLSTHMQMPAWAKGILGSISFHGNGSVLLKRRPCDQPFCGRGGSATMQFSYYAPAWTFLRSLSFHVKAMTSGLDSSFSFRMPRVIPGNALVWSVVEFGRFSDLRQMLAQGETSPYDVTDYGCSILYWAAFKGQTEIYSYLIDNGADPYHRDEDGIACLQPGIDRALSGTQVDRDLVGLRPNTYDADQIFIDESSLDQQEFSLLHRIVLRLHGMNLRSYLDDIGKGLNAVDVNGRTPLLWASWRGDVEAVNLLLQAKADIDKQDRQGYTPLARACKAGHLRCVKLLLQFGSSLTAPTGWGAQPIHLASDNKEHGLAVVQELVRSGANPSAPSELGSPLHNAANRGSLETVKYLISLGVDIDLVDQDGDSPAMVALMCSNQSIFCHLVEMGVRLNNVRKTGENIIHIACWCASESAWKVLEHAAKGGRLAGLDMNATHDGHDLWHCLDTCRGLWYLGDVHEEKVMGQIRNFIKSLT